MWTSLYNFLCNKFFYRPERDHQRSSVTPCNGIYGKRLKLFDRIWDSNGLLKQNKLGSMQKDVDISDDEEDCCFIAEIPRRKIPGNSMIAHNASINESSGTKSQDHRFCTPIIYKAPLKNDNDKNTEEVSFIGDFGRNVNSKLQVKKFFNSPRCSLSQGKQAKFRFSFKNHLRRKMNFLQESYRLTEKIQYIQLLQSHTIYNLFTSRPSLKSCKNKEIEVIDISDEQKINNKPEDQNVQTVAEIPGIRSFQDILKLRPLNAEVVLNDISDNCKTCPDVIQLSENTDDFISNKNKDVCKKTEALEEKLQNSVHITSHEVQEVESEELYYLPELTNEQKKKIRNALILEPKQEVLSKSFGLQITRQDVQTLVGLNWLNDEIINFYMNLIVERSKLNKKLPKVYAFNSFFYPKLVCNGYVSLKRWTKQVDIFSFDIVLVPVHLGMHWCLSVIDFRTKSVKYYDSIGSPNDLCLERLLLYLKAESLDKRKKLFSTSHWKKTNVEDIPQQMNGSDCGVFSCMFAEHLTRDCIILFTQDDMPYFRNKMIIEILEKKLLT